MEKNATFKQPNSTSFLVPKHEGLTFLEQLTVSVLEVSCSAVGVPFIYHVNQMTKAITFVRGSCKSWSCPECAMRNAKRWIARIIDGINKLEGDSWHFATVTAHRWWRGEKSLINLRANWHKLRKRMTRLAKKMGIKLHYARVWEHHKDGSYHMHIICNVPLTTKWLKDNAAECGMGYQAKMDSIINAGQAAGYVAKYMLKQAENDTLHSFPKGARRIEVSSGWVSWQKKKSEDWFYAGDLEQASDKSFYFKRYGNKVNDLAIRNEKKRLKAKYNEYRNTENASRVNEHVTIGSTPTSKIYQETAIERENWLQRDATIGKPDIETRNKATENNIEKSANATERILDER